jgi:hypothetical protein
MVKWNSRLYRSTSAMLRSSIATIIFSLRSFRSFSTAAIRALHGAEQFVLEQRAHPVDLREVLVVEPGHDVPSVDLVGDDAFGLKRPERFAQGAARNADALGQFDLPDLLPGSSTRSMIRPRICAAACRVSCGSASAGRDSATTFRLLRRDVALRFYRNNVCNPGTRRLGT